MTKEQICSGCKRLGATVFTRCGYIMHSECFNTYSRDHCQKCKANSSEYLKVYEELIVKIKSSNLELGTILELTVFLKNLASYQNIDEPCISYDGKLLEQLQRFCWDINNESFGGRMLFYRACIVDDLKKVDLLIEHGLNLEKYGSIGLYHACKNSSYDVFDRLLTKNVDLIQNVIFDLISFKNFGMLKRIIELGADVNLIGIDGIRPIHYASKEGSTEIVQFLIDNGADFDVVDDLGNSIQHYACMSYNGLGLIEYFINSGLDFTTQNNRKQTPIMIAVEMEKTHIINRFIQRKVGLEFICPEGDTPLHWCVAKGHFALVKALLIEGADVNAKNKLGKTPLHVVGGNFHKSEVVELLLDNGADMNVLDNDGKSPLFYFCSKINMNLKIRFIDGGADLTIKNEFGKSILELMIES